MYQEYSLTIYVIHFLDDSTRFCINKSRNYVQSVNIKSTYSEFKSLFTVSFRVYSEYRVKLLCWIKLFAIFTCGLQTYFLRPSRVIGCVYFHTPRQTEPNRSPPSQSVTARFLISTLLKTASPKSPPSVITLNAYREVRRSCVFTCLRHCLKRTRHCFIRSYTKLFISTRSPHDGVTKDTLARGISLSS